MFGIGMPELIIIFTLLTIPVTIVVCVLLLTRNRSNNKISKERKMFCTKCGAQNDDNALKCVQCGNEIKQFQYVNTGDSAGTSVPNYLVQAILVTILCCLPFGIAAIVFAAQVNGKLAAGDYNGAVETSKKARTWCWVSFWVGLGFFILWFFGAIVAGFAGL
jgi:hypothetical protein